MSNRAHFREIPWAGLVLGMPNGAYAVYQIAEPEGHLTIEYEHDMSDGFWVALTKPIITRRTIDIQLRGEVMQWDGRQRPTHVTGPLALPPTPGYTGDSFTRPAVGR